MEVGTPSDGAPADLDGAPADLFVDAAMSFPSLGSQTIGSSVAIQRGYGVAGGPEGTLHYASSGPGGVSGGCCSNAHVTSLAPDNSVRWSRSFGSTSSHSKAADVAVCDDGVYATGYVEGTVTFGTYTPAAIGAKNIFLVKMDHGGTVSWVRRVGAALSEQGNSVACNGDGVWMVGEVGAADFGHGPLSPTGTLDIFIAHYASNGSLRWVDHLGPGGSAAQANGVAADAAGNAYLVGTLAAPVDLGAGVVTPAGISDLFVLAYSAAGAQRWRRVFGSSGADGGWGVALTADADPIVAGHVGSAVDFDGNVVAHAGASDAVVLRLNRVDGMTRWATSCGGSQSDVAYGVDVGATVYLGGVFTGTATFGAADHTAPTGYDGGFLLRVDVDTGAPIAVNTVTYGLRDRMFRDVAAGEGWAGAIGDAVIPRVAGGSSTWILLYTTSP